MGCPPKLRGLSGGGRLSYGWVTAETRGLSGGGGTTLGAPFEREGTRSQGSGEKGGGIWDGVDKGKRWMGTERDGDKRAEEDKLGGGGAREGSRKKGRVSSVVGP